MKLFRATHGFWDEDWATNDELVRHFVQAGTVIAVEYPEPIPKPDFWELIFEFERPVAAVDNTRKD